MVCTQHSFLDISFKTIYYFIFQDQTTKPLCDAILNLITSLFQRSIYDLELETDIDFGHLWVKNSPWCQCRLVTRNQTSSMTYFPNDKQIIPTKKASTITKNSILDHFESKLRAYVSALEISESLASIGTVLFV